MATKKTTTKRALLRRPKTNSEYSVANAAETHARRVSFEGYAVINGRELWMFHPVRAAGKNKP
jgi:hypothetical protein